MWGKINPSELESISREYQSGESRRISSSGFVVVRVQLDDSDLGEGNAGSEVNNAEEYGRRKVR